jgi:hypothetical protein
MSTRSRPVFVTGCKNHLLRQPPALQRNKAKSLFLPGSALKAK